MQHNFIQHGMIYTSKSNVVGSSGRTFCRERLTTLVGASGFGMLKSVLCNTFNTELSMIRPAGACTSRRASSRSYNKQHFVMKK